MNRPTLLLGVDGGGTSTTAWLSDSEGRVLGRSKAGPSNIKTVGAEAARTHLDGSIALAFLDAGLEVAPVAFSCFGLAGFDRPEDKQWLEDWASSSVWVGRLILVNDGELVVAAGTPEGWGVGVIAGTGSIAVGRSFDGRSARAGGWGPLFGDEGSAYAVALAALRLVAGRADGRRVAERDQTGSLTDRICESLGVAIPSELVSAIYREGMDRTRIAALAPLVIAAAATDATVVTEILEPAGFELANMVAAVARNLNMGSGRLPLAMAGTFLLNCSLVSQVLIDRLQNQGFEVDPCAVPEPVEGALVLARRALDS